MVRMIPELAEICGIHAGDGYLRKRGGKGEIDISGHMEEKSYYDDHVVPLFNKVFNLNISGRYFSRGTYGLVIYNKNIAELFNKLGFPFGRKSLAVSVPNLILDSKNKLFYARFLRGLFDTDGGLYFRNRRTGKGYSNFKRKYNYYPIIQIGTVSEKLSKDVSFMLNELSIKHNIFSYQPKNFREKRKYIVAISGMERLEKWMKFIGTKNHVKLSRYLVWKRFGFNPPHTTLRQRKDILNGKLDIYSIKRPVV